MKLYMKQKLFSLKQDFNIYDHNQTPLFRVSGKLFSVGRQLRIYDALTNEELAYVKESPFRFLTHLKVYKGNDYIATIQQKMTLFKTKMTIEDIGWTIQGDFLGWQYVITDEKNQTIAEVKAKMLSWSDTFEITIDDTQVDPIIVLAIILAVDTIRDKQQFG
ncbi:LURP-one-related family protein [Aerococcus urinaeequi]|uniref:LURP-one-related family protein n=1 Tax=Aerococcus urinaeequi TaxID=51665 RepID=A0AAF0BJ21_9LACT|nr:LURP-one-related family protein [Aerococcus urinaeequi]WCG37185.1 LURP-one-related family protein [Aerococcus urinaeequi]